MSSTRINDNLYIQHKEAFLKITKRIIKSKLSKNPVKLEEYKTLLIQTYNDFIIYAREQYASYDREGQDIVRADLLNLKNKLLRCFGKLNVRIAVPPELFRRINVEDLEPEEAIEITDTSSESEEEPENNLGENNRNITNERPANENLNDSQELRPISPNNFEDDTMNNPDFIKLCASTLRDSFDGDPLSLESFINGIDFVEEMAEPTQLQILLKFIKTKLKGKALEVIPTANNTTITDIKNSLRANFKPETSAVIEGRLLALKMNNSNMQDFSKQVEELADALERSFRAEGIPQEKSKQMTVQRTIDLCRVTAKSETVKTIIAATPFNNPKDVIAKFVVETSKDKQERQILTFKANARPNNNRNNGRFNSNNNNNNGNRRDGRGFRNNGNNNNYIRRHNNNNNNNNQRNGRNYYNRNRNNNNGNNSHNYNRSRNSANVRRFEAENSEDPPNLILGGNQNSNHREN